MSSAMTPNDVSEARLLIDEKIAHLSKCIRQLKSERNRLSPVSRLPPEILGTVFSFACTERDYNSPIFPCYYFTHVSLSWRSVALTTPNLWQVLPRSIPWTTVMLERSKGTDLVVGGRISSDRSFLKEVITKYASRIGELDLSCILLALFNFENLPHSLHRLRSLRLANVLGKLKSTSQESLRTHTWCSLSLPALTNLSLCDIPNPPPLTKFLDMLRRLIALNVLDMVNSLPKTDDHISFIDPVNLPNLNYLSLSSKYNPKEITNILSHVIVPPTARFNITARNTTHIKITHGFFEELTSSFSTFLGRLQQRGVPLSELYIRSGPEFLTMTGRKRVGGITEDEFNLALAVPTLSNFAPSMLRQILPSLPLLDLDLLCFDGSLGRLLEDTFGQIPCLRNVSIFGDCAVEFIHALSHRPETGPSTVLFPALQSLKISCCHFTRGGERTLDELQKCIIERRDRAQLLRVTLLNCPGIRDKDVDRLREVVPEIQQSDSEEDLPW